MKPLLLTLIAAFFVTACATDEPAQPRTATAGKPRTEAKKDDGSSPPRVGMTKEQVRAKYGRPVSTSVSSRGECWAYAFNRFDWE